MAEVQTDESRVVLEFVEQVEATADEHAARAAFREGFSRLRAQLPMYPVRGLRPSATFESAARTVRLLASHCLPLSIAVAMHLYPLCALQGIPIPLLSPARWKRAMLLWTVRSQSLILANAGSERVRGVDQPLLATRCADGIRIDGRCEYLSLASVADVVFFQAQLASSDRVVLCAADLRAATVRIGPSKFSGRMRLSDTCSVTFSRHRVPRGRYLLVPRNEGLQCIADYQRCWFQLFLAETYLARVEHLQQAWELPRLAEQVVSLNEVARLREYSLHLLDACAPNAGVATLLKATSALKLRVSWIAQATIAALRARDTSSAADARRLAADADELFHIKLQPTADEKILRSLGVLGATAA